MIWPPIAQLIRLPNQTGTLLLLLPTLWALVLASEGTPSLPTLTVFVVGSFLMRSAGVAMNDLADRRFDQQVTRTQARPLASGTLSMKTGLLVVVLLLLLSAALLPFLNLLSISLSPIAVALAACYPFSKRFLHIPQAVLGIAFGWGAVMAWAAVRNNLDQPVWLLFIATICWAIAYDTIYALQDKEDDVRIGVKSSAIFFGSWTWVAVGCCSALMVVCLAASMWMLSLNPLSYLLLALSAGWLGYQVWELRGPVTPRRAFTLFKQHVGIGAAILAGFLVGTL